MEFYSFKTQLQVKCFQIIFITSFYTLVNQPIIIHLAYPYLLNVWFSEDSYLKIPCYQFHFNKIFACSFIEKVPKSGTTGWRLTWIWRLFILAFFKAKVRECGLEQTTYSRSETRSCYLVSTQKITRLRGWIMICVLKDKKLVIWWIQTKKQFWSRK